MTKGERIYRDGDGSAFIMFVQKSVILSEGQVFIFPIGLGDETSGTAENMRTGRVKE